MTSTPAHRTDCDLVVYADGVHTCDCGAAEAAEAMAEQERPDLATMALDYLARTEQQFVLWDVVEILQGDDPEAWDQVAPGTGSRQHLCDGYGNSVQFELAGHGSSVTVLFRWAAGDRQEMLQLDTRGGATRIARVVQVLADAPGDDAL